MTLDPNAIYPNARRYVLKLHRDANPAQGPIHGRVENMASGRQFEFRTAEELLVGLIHDLRLDATAPGEKS
jgi:hypothetical protein